MEQCLKTQRENTNLSICQTSGINFDDFKVSAYDRRRQGEAGRSTKGKGGGGVLKSSPVSPGPSDSL